MKRFFLVAVMAIVAVFVVKAEPISKEEIVKKSIEANFNAKISEKAGNMDYFVATVRFTDGDSVNIPLKGANKFGCRIGIGAGMDVCKNVVAPNILASLKYDKRYWGVMLNCELGKLKYSQKALNVGRDYLTFRTKAVVICYPFKLDNNEVWRLGFGAGAMWEYYKTDTPILEDNGMNSGGSSIKPIFTLVLSRRLFATGNDFTVAFDVAPSSKLWQNLGFNEYGVYYCLKTTFNLGLGMGRFNNNKKLDILRNY